MTPMTPREILTGTRSLLSDPRKWTTGWFAKCEAGIAREATDEKAVCWCVAGGIQRVSDGRPAAYFEALRGFIRANAIRLPSYEDGAEDGRDWLEDMHNAIGGFNDSIDHTGILAALDKAIAAEAANV